MSEPYLDPLTLSRQLGKLRAEERAFQRRARRGLASVSPFSVGLFPGKTEYDRVLELPADDALRAALLRHLQALIRARVQLPWTTRILESIYFERHPVVEPLRAELTLDEVRKKARAATTSHAPWAHARDELSAQLLPLYEELWHREPEIDRRLGASAAELEPWDDILVMSALAEEVLARTREPLEALGYLGERERNELEMRDASEGWPARLGMESLLGLFRERQWYRGLALGDILLPARITPASFLLALEELGFQMGLALARRDLPFVIAHTPFDDVAWRLGAELGLVATTRSFQERRLGLGHARADMAERALSVLVLVELRRRAARFLLTEAAKAGREALAELGPRVAQELGHNPPARGALSHLFRIEPSGIGFFSLLQAGQAAERARQNFDEDWFDDPRALDELRARAETPREKKVSAQELRDPTLRWLDELVGRL
jgi:hypothetical protein